MIYLEKVKNHINEVLEKPFTEASVKELYYLLKVEKLLTHREDYKKEMKDMPMSKNPY